MPTTALWASDNVCSGGADATGLDRERRKESRKGKKESQNSSFRFFCAILWKNSNLLFGQHSKYYKNFNSNAFNIESINKYSYNFSMKTFKEGAFL